MVWNGRVKDQPTVYAVHWPQINTFKIGFSEYKRWRAFENRGANILDLMRFGHFKDAYDFESACHYVMTRVCRPGFSKPKEAEPYLGGRGGGYLECYKVPGDLMPAEVLDFVDSQLAALVAEPEHMPEHHAREQCTDGTHGLTQNHSPSEHLLTLVNARGGAAKNG